MLFKDLKLCRPVLKALKMCSFEQATAVQTKSIPLVLSGKNVIASAQTGTGKTAAFILPILHRLSVKKGGRKGMPRVLVLSPTRELAQQVAEETKKFARFLNIKTCLILGGMSYHSQFRGLSGSVDIVVGTPGRLLDHLQRGSLDLSGLEILVLDEADRMLDMGFKRDVEKIINVTPTTRQTLLFTATLDKATSVLANSIMDSPVRIEVARGRVTLDTITQHIYLTDSFSHKKRLLRHMIKDSALNKALVFAATKRGAEDLARELRKQGHRAAALHGDMSQSARSRTMARMRAGKVRLLIATDVAARGLDVTGITHVINFDLPQAPNDYVHRIGRTGRAGATGTAISFACGSKDAAQLKAIERFIGKRISRKTIKGLEPKRPLAKPISTKRSFKPGKKKKRFSFGLKDSGIGKKRTGTIRIIK